MKIGYITAIASGLMLTANVASAQDYDGKYATDYDGEQKSQYQTEFDDEMEPAYTGEPTRDNPRLVTPMGMGFSVGGAYSDFTDFTARGFTKPGGGWEARAIIGTRTRVAAEAAYVGTANNIDALGVTSDAVLMSNGVEGSLRVNILTGAWQPYVLGGLGWKHYNVVNTPTNTSDIRDVDNALTVPVGAGLSYRFDNFFADIRGTFKPSYLADITRGGGEGDASLHTYGAQGNLGFEF